MLAIRHDPQRTGEAWAGFVGNERAVQTLRMISAEARQSGDPVAFLIDGESGIGKSLGARLAATVELGAEERSDDVRTTPSGHLTADEVALMEDRFGHTSLFGSGWRVWIIEELDKAEARQINKLLTILDTLPRRTAVFMTTNIKVQRDSLFKERRASIPEETEKALLGRAYPVHMTKAGLATTGATGQERIGPGALRVKQVAQRIGFNGRPDKWYVDFFRRDCHGSIREAINRLATLPRE